MTTTTTIESTPIMIQSSLDQQVNHWLYSIHPLRLRLVSPRQSMQQAFLAPDGLPLKLHRASGAWMPQFDLLAPVTENGPANDDDNNRVRVELIKRSHERRGPVLHRPFFYVDDWTILSRQVYQLSSNSSYPNPPALIQVRPCSLGRMRIFLQLAAAFKMLTETMMVSEGDLDELKRYLSDEYLFRFALMQIISFAHAILSFMAFKNDGNAQRTVRRLRCLKYRSNFCFSCQITTIQRGIRKSDSGKGARVLLACRVARLSLTPLHQA
jgi:hypothetical protein